MVGERRKRKCGVDVVGRLGKGGKEVSVMAVLVDASAVVAGEGVVLVLALLVVMDMLVRSTTVFSMAVLSTAVVFMAVASMAVVFMAGVLGSVLVAMLMEDILVRSVGLGT